MPHLRIVGDGERDAVTLPPLVKRILKAEFTHESKPWPRLHRGEKKIPGYTLRGYGRKLLYILKSARNADADGLVACADADRERGRERLKQMKLAREADRAQHPPIPAALGEARPHNEAWLLDDPAAVREALGLPKGHEVPNAVKCRSPKSALEQLHAESERSDQAPLEVWPTMAQRLDVRRCTHKQDTGFEAFIEEVQAELGPLFARAG